jgi:ribonuclease P protein component
MPILSLRGRKICDLVLRKGRAWKGKTFTVRWLPGAPRHPAADPAKRALYVGSYAPAKLDKSAVRRNRMRRRVREALRLGSEEFDRLPTAQLLLCPLHASLEANFADILSDMRRFLSDLDAWQQPPHAAASSTSSSSSPSRSS